MDDSGESKILVTSPPPSAEDQVQFLTNIQRILAEGSFVATYKYALLLAFADTCLEQGSDSGDALAVSTAEIAEKFIQYYWLQCRPYRSSVLKQNTGKSPEVFRLLEDTSARLGGSMFEAKKNTNEWRKLVRAVEQVVKKMPLWRLQTVGRTSVDVLYPNIGHGNAVFLRPGVPFCFRKFYQLIGDLVRGAWVRYVRRYNPDVFGSTDDLHEFLFGSERSNLQQVGRLLYDTQKGICFYCQKSLSPKAGHVDHFIPWSRYPIDLGHNFVLAHSGCNAAKSDFLAAELHLSRWFTTSANSVELAVRFDERRIIHDFPRSLRIAEWAYNQAAAAGALTWLRGRDCIPLPHDWKRSLERRN